MKYYSLLFVLFGLIYGYRPYSYFINGAKTEAVGRVSSINLLSSEVLFNNPAFLSGTSNALVYEFNSDLGFKGFTTDYRLSFDLGNLGYIFSKKNKNRKVNHYGISYSTLFKSDVLENINEVGIPKLAIRQLGFSHGFRIGRYFSFGYTVGLAIAIDSSPGFLNSFFALSPTAKFGIVLSLNKNILIGSLVSLPLYLDWNLLSSYDLIELTPFHVSSGVKIRLSPNVVLLTEINYQSWDTSSYKLQGTERYIDKGNSAFDYGQNLFVNLGLYIHGQKKKSQLTSPARNELAEKIKNEIKNINDQLKEIENNSFLNDLEKKIYEQLAQERELKKVIHSLKSKRKNSSEDLNELLAIKKEIAEKNKEIKKNRQEREDDLILFGAKENQKNLEDKINQLNLEVTQLNKKSQSIQYSFLSEEEKATLNNSYIELEKLSQKKQISISKISALKRNEKKNLNEIVKRGTQGEHLSKEEQFIYERQFKKNELLVLRKKKHKELKKVYNKNRFKIRGEFYLGYSPEVVYDADGNFRRIGNLTLGFSFRATNVKNLYFTISLTDRTILRLLQIHPENDPTEIIKITSSYHFGKKAEKQLN